MSLLETRGLVKRFGGQKAVNGVDLRFEEGELCSIIGPNGAGKTTFFNLLSGQLKSDGGEVIFRGENITNSPPYKIAEKGIAKSFQITSIFPRLTVLENVQVAMQTKQKRSLNFLSSAKKVFYEESYGILEMVGLASHANEVSGELSHGDQKLIELAIGLAGDPHLLLLDEPMAGLASEERMTTGKLIHGLNQERGLSILFVEHDMDVVLTISKRIVVMDKGSIIAQGKPEDIKQNEEVRRVYLGE
jgi:branched-chain amino acid transport system ATP-binding protein